MHVAIAEDDTDQAALLCHWLESGDHTARAAPTLAAFQELLKRERFDALLVDWMLPDATGDQVLTWVRENLGWELPTIVVTARDDEETVCAALKAGADDYVVKPPKPRELLARMTAVARRGNTRELPVLRLGTYEVDITRPDVPLIANVTARPTSVQ